MVPQAKEDFLRSIVKSNFDRHHEILDSLPLKSPDNVVDAVPVRISIRTGSSGSSTGGSYLSSYATIMTTSRPLPKSTLLTSPHGTNEKDDDSRRQQFVSLRVALVPIVKKWVDEQTAAAVAARDHEDDEEDVEFVWSHVDTVVVGGVTPPQDALLLDLHRDLHAPDFFLYVVLHMKCVERV